MCNVQWEVLKSDFIPLHFMFVQENNRRYDDDDNNDDKTRMINDDFVFIVHDFKFRVLMSMMNFIFHLQRINRNAKIQFQGNQGVACFFTLLFAL